MEFKGHIEHGAVVLDGVVDLPDGTPVTIQTAEVLRESGLHPDIRRLAGLLPEQFDAEQSRLESILEKHG